jgi:putative peptide zinc metalloprotease protein
MRPDLSARRQRYHGDSYWVVKEPVGLNYFRFHEEEFAILQMLDGHTSLEEIKERFEGEYTPQKITYQDLQQFIGMLHRSGLVISEAAGQGRQLRKRGEQKRRREWLGKLSNVFAIRFRGIDPEWLLTRWLGYTRWLFRPTFVTCWLMLVLSALALVFVQFEVFRSRLPTFHQFFGPHNWIYLGVAMAVIKVLHEFGHGLSCKHFGGECHEMGLMFLVFTPCLYCNVSDSWMLPNKWHRVIIGAAGMYIESILAATATFLWWFSEPGLLNHICLSIMFICSVSTIVFNGNPLLRYDGYYMLMDMLEIPNLRQKSTEVLKRFMVDLCLGIEQPDNPFLPQKHRFFFGAFTIAAVLYRWLVVFSIVFFLNRVFEPYGLKIIGQLIGALGFFGLVVQPLWQLGKFFYMPGRMHKVKRPRLIASVCAAVALVAAIIFLPLPFSVKCTLEVQPKDAAAVYADVPGRLDEIHVKEGERVSQGQPLANLINRDLELAVLKLEGQRKQTLTRLRSLEKERFQDDRASLQVQQLREVLAAVTQQLTEKQQEFERLKITAPVAGVVIPAPVKPAHKEEGKLPGWSGSPLHPKNVGAAFMASDMLCRIGDPHDLEAVLVVDQGDIEFVDDATRDGRQPEVSIRLDAFPGTTLVGRVVEVAKVDLKVTPANLSSRAGGELDTKMDASGVQRPMSTSFQALVPLGKQGKLEGLIRPGLRGRAKIYTRWQSLGKRVYRYVARTFHFEL